MAFFLTFAIFLHSFPDVKRESDRLTRRKPERKNGEFTPPTSSAKVNKQTMKTKNNFENENEDNNLVFVAQKPWLSVKEFAAYTGYKVSYVYKLISQRGVPCYKRDGGKNVFFLKDEIDKWILGHRIAPMEELEEQAVRYVAKNSIQDVVFAPSKKFAEEVDDDGEDEKPKKSKAKSATTKKASAKTSKAKEKPAAKTKKGTKKAPSKKSKDEEESPKKGKKTTKKTPTKTKKTTKKK